MQLILERWNWCWAKVSRLGTSWRFVVRFATCSGTQLTFVVSILRRVVFDFFAHSLFCVALSLYVWYKHCFEGAINSIRGYTSHRVVQTCEAPNMWFYSWNIRLFSAFSPVTLACLTRHVHTAVVSGLVFIFGMCSGKNPFASTAGNFNAP